MVRLQRSLGGRSRYKNGAMIGLGAGVVAGVVGAGNVTRAAGQFKTVVGIGLLGGMGGLVIAVIGREKWECLDIPGQGAASIMPVIGVHPTGRLALGARISF